MNKNIKELEDFQKQMLEIVAEYKMEFPVITVYPSGLRTYRFENFFMIAGPKGHEDMEKAFRETAAKFSKPVLQTVVTKDGLNLTGMPFPEFNEPDS